MGAIKRRVECAAAKDLRVSHRVLDELGGTVRTTEDNIRRWFPPEGELYELTAYRHRRKSYTWYYLLRPDGGAFLRLVSVPGGPRRLFLTDAHRVPRPVITSMKWLLAGLRAAADTIRG